MAILELDSPVKFLGGYVTSISSNFGWNTNPSTMNIDIVSKTGEAEFDPNLAANANGTFHTLDMSDFSPASTFKFSGIITSKNFKFKNISGIHWSIQISDPRLIMRAVTLILTPNPGNLGAGTDGRVIDVYNALNSSSSLVNLSSYNSGGTSVGSILFVLGMIDADAGTPGGIIVPPPAFTYTAEVYEEKYHFVFDDLALINSNFMITGETITLLDFFQQIGQGAALDWYIESDNLSETGDSYHTVHIKAISRQTNNTEISLQDFMDTINSGSQGDIIPTASSGLELRTDSTGSILFSDRREFMDHVPRQNASSLFHFDLPTKLGGFFGSATSDNFFQSFEDNIQPHRVKLAIDKDDFEPIDEDQIESRGYLVEDNEMRAALMGLENWILYLAMVRQGPTDIITDDSFILKEGNNEFDLRGFSETTMTEEWFENMTKLINESIDGNTKGTEKLTGSISVYDLNRLRYDADELVFMRKVKSAYDVVKNYSNEVYGKTYTFPERKDAEIINAASTRTISITSHSAGNQHRKKLRRAFEFNIFGTDRRNENINAITNSAGYSVDVDNFFDDGSGKGKTKAYIYFNHINKNHIKDMHIIINESSDNIFFVPEGEAGIFGDFSIDPGDTDRLFVKAEISNGLIKIAPVYDLRITPCVIDDMIASAILKLEDIIDEDVATQTQKDKELIFDEKANKDMSDEEMAELIIRTVDNLAFPRSEMANEKIILLDTIDNGDDKKYQMAPYAKMPDGIYIPYKHKKDVWRAYSSYSDGDGFGEGPISVEKDESLNPANYSSFIAMDVAGVAKVQNSFSPVKNMEMGSISAVGLPEYNIGSAVGINSNITNISISFAIGGINTTYSLESFTKRYGKKDKIEFDGAAKLITEANKIAIKSNEEILRMNREQVNILADTTKYFIKINSQLSVSNDSISCKKIIFPENTDTDNKGNDKSKDGDSIPVIMGKVGKFIDKAAEELGEAAGAIVNQIAKIMFGDGITSSTLEGWQDFYATDVGMFYIPFNMGDQLEDGGEETFEDTGSHSAGDINPYKPIDVDEEYGRFLFRSLAYGENPRVGGGFDINKIRGMAVRVPMMVAGWGYDTSGQPTFEEEADKLDFSKQKVGPADWRWDDDRKVWTMGGGGIVRWLQFDP